MSYVLENGMESNYVKTSLGDVLKVQRGSVLNRTKAVPGQIPVIAGGKSPAYYHNSANRAGPTITISASGANAGYVAYYDMPIFASDCSTISEGTDYDLRYVYFFLLSRQMELYSAQKGGAQPHVNPKDVQRLDFIKPPLAEQTAIANILSDQEALIAQYDNLIALHEKRFAYLSDELLSGRLNLQKNEKGLTIGEGPTDNWLKSTVKNAVSIFNGYPCSSTQMSDDFVNGVPILKMSNIEDGAIVLLEQGSQKYFVDPLRLESVPQKNDMLVGLSGSVGKSGVFGVKAKCIVNQRIAILRVKDANFDQDFFNFMWVWCLIDALLKNVQSSTIGNVSTKDVEELSFSHPPLEEQTLIANVLSDQEALIAQYKKLRDAEKKRFDWLSDALLSGTYRVKVEP